MTCCLEHNYDKWYPLETYKTYSNTTYYIERFCLRCNHKQIGVTKLEFVEIAKNSNTTL